MEPVTRVTHSSDGSVLAFTSVGEVGPGILVVHGAMQVGASQRDFAQLLAARGFRVHLMDRRGRGRSGPLQPGTRPESEVDDVIAVIAETGARRCVGVSSGALLAARSALARPGSLDRLVLFEPPLAVDESLDLSAAQRVDGFVQQGRLASAMAEGMRAAEMGPPWMFRLPKPMLAALSRGALRRPGVAERAAALPADFAVVVANAGRLSDFAALDTPSLVVDGTATRPYLRRAAAALAETIPLARHLTLDGLTHSATQNAQEYGHPDVVVQGIADFLV